MATIGFAQLRDLLASDPENLSLLGDAAEAAFAEDDLTSADALVARAEALAPLSPSLQHLAGLIAMRQERWAVAEQRYAALLAQGADAPPVRFNLAWSRAMDKQFAAALEVLTDATAEALPQAAQLQVGLLHQLGEIDLALTRARTLLALFPDHRGLNAVVSTLAIDGEDLALARDTATRAGDHPDALVTLGTLALGDEAVDAAESLFAAALASNAASPRAWVGQGLAKLARNEPHAAITSLDRGAALFGDHLGSWLAAGWAHAITGNIALGRARFETAIALDDRFGEAQGSLAVIDFMEGRVDEARRRTEIALRLDRHSFAGALAAMMLKAGEGDEAAARRIFERALSVPIDPQGRTLSEALVRLGGLVGDGQSR